MANLGFRVDVSRKAPDMILLGENIILKHTLDSEASVLKVLPMDDMGILVIDVRGKHTLAQQLNRDKELSYELRDQALGIYPGQEPSMPGTVLYYIMSGRDILLGVYKNSKHLLGDFGFEISRGGTSVKIPRKAPEIIELAKNMIAKNTEMGADSPIAGMNIVDFTAKTTIADTKNTLAVELNRQKEVTNLLRDRLLGIEKGQKIGSPGTLLFYITSVRDVLLGLFKKYESQLGLWGFDVQFGPSAPSGTKLLTGMVSDVAGVSISGAILTLTPGNFSVNSNSTGMYAFYKIFPGVYTLQTIKGGYDTDTAPNITIVAGDTATKNVILIAKAGSLIVKVYHGAEPLANAAVKILETTEEITTGEDGIATFLNLVAGNYNIEVTAPGFQPQTKPIIISSGVSDMLIFELIPG